MELSLDIWSYICQLISNNRDKFHLLIITKEISKCDFRFTEKIDVSLIIRSKWFDYFTNIFNVYYLNVLPKFAAELDFGAGFKQNIEHLPSSVTHLTLHGYNVMAYGKIPSSITHLTFRGGSYVKIDTLEGVPTFFPPSVTHLAISKIIRSNDILSPNLILDEYFNETITDKIPEHVKYLTINQIFDFYDPGCIPKWIKKVTLIGTYSDERLAFIREFIPPGCQLIIKN